MRRRALAAVFLVLAAACGAIAWWRAVPAPLARAKQVADVLSGREQERLSKTDGHLEKAEQWLLWARGIPPSEYVVSNAEWATRELPRLAKHHPRALGRVASVEPSPDVRWALLDVIEDHPAWGEVPFDKRLEHVTMRVSRRLSRPNAKPMTLAQIATLKAGGEEAGNVLRRLVREGHCGALAGMEILELKATQEDLGAAAGALVKAATDPFTDLTPTIQDHCRDVFHSLGAPKTDGEFHVIPPGAGK